MTNTNICNSKKYLIDEFDNVNNRIYRSYSVSKSFLPKNFVPILKPKKCNFEEEIPFSLQLSNQIIENEEIKTNDSYSNCNQNVENNNDDYYKRNKSLSFDIHVNNQKKHITTILGKLKEKNHNE
jgi:FtsZ-binding cell division protein ZapB